MSHNTADWEEAVSGSGRLLSSEMTFKVPFSLEGLLVYWAPMGVLDFSFLHLNSGAASCRVFGPGKTASLFASLTYQ